MTRICFISDTHTYHNEIKIPDADIIVHSGDYSFTGTVPEVNGFLTWYAALPHKHKVLINGNHEKVFWKNPTLFMSMIPSNINFLLDSMVTINGLNFYGSPHTREFYGWAYPYFNDEEAAKIWNKIPLHTDILVTHMPPYEVRDGVPFRLGREGLYVPSLDEDGDPQGCKILRDRVRVVKPIVHAFGHIHEGAGFSQIGEVLYVNASICTPQYKPTNLPTVVDIKNGKVMKVDYA